jgi:hypothetical protein
VGTETTVPKPPDIPQPQPPRGAIAIDPQGRAHQRALPSEHTDVWWPHGWTWVRLLREHGPLTVVYTPPSDAPAAVPEPPRGLFRVVRRGKATDYASWSEAVDAYENLLPQLWQLKHGAWTNVTAAALGATQERLTPRTDKPAAGDVTLLLRWFDPEQGTDTWSTLAEGIHTVAAAQRYAEERFAETTLGRDSQLVWRRHNGADVAGYLPDSQEPLYMVRPAAVPEPPALAVYVAEGRVPQWRGPWRRSVPEVVYGSDVAVMAALEREHGALEWDAEGQARQPGDAVARYRIVRIPLAGSGAEVAR